MTMLDTIKKFLIRRFVKMDEVNLGIGMYDNSFDVERWKSIYNDTQSWKYDRLGKMKIKGSGIPASLASELARLTTVELDSNVVGGDKAEYINKYYKRGLGNLRQNIEYGLALGGLIIKPLYISVDGGEDKIAIEYVKPGDFIATKFDYDGNMIGAVFIDSISKGNEVYTRLEFHELEDSGRYTIVNRAFRGKPRGNKFGVEVDLDLVEEWSNIVDFTEYDNLDGPLFGYFKVPFADNNDANSDLGVSIFSRVEGLIEETDRLYTEKLREYSKSSKKILISQTFFEGGLGGAGYESLEGEDKDLYVLLDSAAEDTPLEVFSPEIRDESYDRGLEALYRSIEFNIGLAYGTLSDVSDTEKTATEVKSSNERSYNTVSDIQSSLELCLLQLIYGIDILVSKHGPNFDDESVDSYFHFDDSVIVTEVEDIKIMFEEVKLGIITPEQYLTNRYGYSEEESIKRVGNFYENSSD